jgi:acyl-CoA synthetase (AMP-forming)/AMP-acid ligase II
LNEPEKTSECLDSDGWLRTGDVAYADEDGYFYIADRLKELIKYKGFQVPPAELEALLCTHPDVADACVIPVPDEEAGELPRAYVVKRLDASLSEKDVEKFVAERASPHKKLRGGVVFVKSIPKTASGKILRREVVAMDREKGKK